MVYGNEIRLSVVYNTDVALLFKFNERGKGQEILIFKENCPKKEIDLMS